MTGGQSPAAAGLTIKPRGSKPSRRPTSTDIDSPSTNLGWPPSTQGVRRLGVDQPGREAGEPKHVGVGATRCPEGPILWIARGQRRRSREREGERTRENERERERTRENERERGTSLSGHRATIQAEGFERFVAPSGEHPTTEIILHTRVNSTIISKVTQTKKEAGPAARA